MSSKNLNRSLSFKLPQKLLRFTGLIAFLACATFVTNASAQTITSTTATWAPNLPSSSGWPGAAICLAGDVNGDGATDLVCLNADYNSPRYYPGEGGKDYYSLVPSSAFVLETTKGASSGFSTTTAIGTISSTTVPAYTKGLVGAGPPTGACALGDFDGDGRDDLACFQTTYGVLEGVPGVVVSENWPTVWFSTNTAPLSLQVANQNLTLPLQQTSEGDVQLTNPFSSWCFVGHFMAGPGQQILCDQPNLYVDPDGGGQTIVRSNNWYLWRYVASYSSSGVESVTETQYNWTVSINPPMELGTTGDFNGDGLTDTASADGEGITGNLTTGTGFAPLFSWPTNDSSYGGSCTTGDFNGDGLTDVTCYMGTTTTTPVSGIFHVYLSTGSGFQPYQTWLFPNMPPLQNPGNLPDYQLPTNQVLGQYLVPAGQTTDYLDVFQSICTTADLNGDGKTDLLCYANNSSSPGQWIYGLSTGSGFTGGTLNSITPPLYAYTYRAGPYQDTDTVITSAIPFYAPSCLVGNFMGNGLPDILCDPTSGNSPSVGIISRQ